jgi:hypothetical protein
MATYITLQELTTLTPISHVPQKTQSTLTDHHRGAYFCPLAKA